MYCSKCGFEIKNEMKFCPKCGAAMKDGGELQAEQESFVANGNEDEQKNKFFMFIERNKKAASGFVVVLLFVLIISLSRKASSISNKDFSNLMKSNVSMNIGVTTPLTVNQVNIVSKKKGKERDQVKVICDVTMSNNAIAAEARYQVSCRKENEKWNIVDSNVTTIYDIKPLQGAEEPVDLIKDTIHGFYPEINWTYQYNDIFSSKNINFDFPITWNLVERNTDLEEKIDQLKYEYSFDTYAAHITGSFEFNYEFTNNAMWEVTEIRQSSSDIEWNLKGIWSFDIFTYYVDVNILDIDFNDHTVTLERRGSAFQGSGNVENIQIGFAEADGCLYFDTFVIPATTGGASDHEITLTAKMDDLYYQYPSLFAGVDPFDMAIGGKSSY